MIQWPLGENTMDTRRKWGKVGDADDRCFLGA